MTKLADTVYICSLCGNSFKSEACFEHIPVGIKNDELREKMLGPDPLYYELHTCPRCGFTDYFHSQILTDEQKARIRSFLNQYLKDKEITELAYYEKYELTAKVYELLAIEAYTIAKSYLKASWIADDKKIPHLREKYRKQALTYFEISLDVNNFIDEEEKNKCKYLIGELNRKLKNYEKSIKWFNEIQVEENWFQELLDQQEQKAKNQIRV